MVTDQGERIMEVRRRREEAAAVEEPSPRTPAASDSHSRFQFSLWFLLAVENWVLDFGRPIAMVQSYCQACVWSDGSLMS